ncbi:hypothetical protein SUGI_0436830 [Cryptomeria japonica]|nr:hypothetical protein SUGI_0436830 [Cryptomeria japonica]
MVKKNGTSFKKTSSRIHLHSDLREKKQNEPNSSASPPLDPSSLPRVVESIPTSDPTPPISQPQTHPCPSSNPPSIAESVLKYQSALKEAIVAASEPESVELDNRNFSNNLGGPKKQNAQQIVLDKLKIAAEQRKQLELTLINQKKDIDSCTIPFHQELIGGEDGGTHITTKAIEMVNHSPHEPKDNINDPSGEMNIPHIENTPLESKDGGDT